MSMEDPLMLGFVVNRPVWISNYERTFGVAGWETFSELDFLPDVVRIEVYYSNHAPKKKSTFFKD